MKLCEETRKYCFVFIYITGKAYPLSLAALPEKTFSDTCSIYHCFRIPKGHSAMQIRPLSPLVLPVLRFSHKNTFHPSAKLTNIALIGKVEQARICSSKHTDSFNTAIEKTRENEGKSASDSNNAKLCESGKEPGKRSEVASSLPTFSLSFVAIFAGVEVNTCSGALRPKVCTGKDTR
jgi:hypothetical protein